MVDSHDRSPVRSERNGDIAIIYASDYLNKLSGERGVARQAEYLEELRGLRVDVREDERRARAFSRVNHAEHDRDADAVDESGVFEVHDERAATRGEGGATFAFDPFAAQLVEIVAGINECDVPAALGAHRRTVVRVNHFLRPPLTV